VSPGLKYTLARFGIFVACTVPAILLLPQSLDLLLRVLIGAVLSAVVSLLLLRRWRGQMADQISAGLQSRREEKERLRAALAGEDEPETETAPKPE
jgi:uncharacterized membrane protein YccC